MPGSWLHRYLENHRSDEIRKKGARLGKFTPAPMVTTTLDIHGMITRDALEIVERKLNRALAAGTKEIRVLHAEQDKKLTRRLHQFLETLSVVSSIDFSDDQPGITVVHLS